MYEMIILAFLMRGPMHGYLITKIINDMIGPYARLSNGRLYPLLNKLEASGLIIVQASEPAQRSRAHEITDAGRERLHQLMMDTTSNPGDYQRIFWFKLPYLEFLTPAERLYLLDHFINFCQTHLFHVRSEMADLARKAENHPGFQRIMTPPRLDATIRAMQHLEKFWELERENAEEWRAHELAAREGPDKPERPEQTANR